MGNLIPLRELGFPVDTRPPATSMQMAQSATGGTRNKMEKTRFAKIWEEALGAGLEAGAKHTPTPMIVVQHADPFRDKSSIVKQYPPVMGGVCGFAWVSVKPGTSSFARWLKAAGLARADSYYGGVTYWVSLYNQSMERKEAHAQAMAEVLRKYGIKAYAQSRMD